MANGVPIDGAVTNGHAAPARPPSLDTAVRRRRTDQAFFIRLGQAIAQHEHILERLSR